MNQGLSSARASSAFGAAAIGSILGPAVVVAAAVVLGASANAQELMTRVSVDSKGRQADDASGFYATPSSISADGRYVAFDSIATDLVEGDTNGTTDVFVHDLVGGGTVRVSVDSSGGQGNGASRWPSVSADGRFVAFGSYASNLVAGDANGLPDVFVRDRDPDGNGVFDEGNSLTLRVSVRPDGGDSDGASYTPSISADGSRIAFAGEADDLVGDDTNGRADVFVRDLVAGTTIRASVDSSGSEAHSDSYYPAISADGRYVAFQSYALDLVANDANGVADIFVRDLLAGQTTRASVDSAGGEADDLSNSPAISAHGEAVVFTSRADDLVAGDFNASTDVFVHDQTTGATTRVSVDSFGHEHEGESTVPSISADGRFVVFQGESLELVDADLEDEPNVFLHDRTSGATTLVNVNCAGQAAEYGSFEPAISADGRFVAFMSHADNLVDGDTNFVSDVFVRDLTIAPFDASWSNYGAGYAGTLGVPSLVAEADPVLGSTLTVDVGNSAGAPTYSFLLLGLDADSKATKFGGTLLVELLFSLPLSLPTDGLSLQYDVPGDSTLCGQSVFVQVLELDDGAAFGWSFTRGLQLTFGG
jgi:Tol biopolymer transport system component